jgi:signal peptidase I
MEPTIKKGELLIADMTAYSAATPARWDVVIFTHPQPRHKNQPWCFRVVGLPGESIDIRPQGIFVNGTNTPLPIHLRKLAYVAAIPQGPPPTALFPFSIPAGHYFLLGDNSTNAFDSRYWGPLPLTNIIGKVARK